MLPAPVLEPSAIGRIMQSLPMGALLALAACGGRAGEIREGSGSAAGSGTLSASGSATGMSSGATSGASSGGAPSGLGVDASMAATSGGLTGLPDAGEADATDAAHPSTGDGSRGSSDAGAFAPNCAPGGPGLSNCGATEESCCASEIVAGGTFFRTYSVGPTGPINEADPATVSSFQLDKYLVTVGRFRQFANAWNNGSGYEPPVGSGKHAYLNNGQGLNMTGGGYEPGWVASSDSLIAPTSANLDCGTGTYPSWTSAVGANENLPINCVNAWEAQAFCIWDGGFLPSEAEWEYAAAGGSQQREFPWGSIDPGTNSQYAIYDGDYTRDAGACPGSACFAPVGTATLGVGLFGQLDLVGEVFEWTPDTWGVGIAFVDPCKDCAHLGLANDARIPRGGYIGSGTLELLSGAPTTFLANPSTRYLSLGFRCARPPPSCPPGEGYGANGTCGACTSGESLCDDFCVDEKTDSNNCGGCGITCPSGVSCQGGSCCPGGGTVCGNACVNEQTDRANCGACGTQCGSAAICQGGLCVACPSGQRVCDDACFDLDHDPSNCGLCGRVCPDSVACGGGTCEAASCEDLPATCGPFAEDCCVHNAIMGGTYDRSNDPKFPATVSDFFMDDYEITVGRFRKFIDAEIAGWRPTAGAGKHSHLNGGMGLNGGTEAGWDPSWTPNLATTATGWTTNLLSCAGVRSPSWTEMPGANESLPVDCLSWYEANAFCIWDGGFLPTEAEWNYVAAGGSDQRVYPWSNPPTSTTIDCTYANYGGCVTPAGTNHEGSEVPNGDGAFDQYDLAGNVAEWVLDAEGAYPTPCNDCANLTGPGGIVRGGDSTSPPAGLLTSARGSPVAPDHVRFGARCARPQ
jgi:sulfatase modifying factor 1